MGKLWTPADLETLKELAQAGGSLARIASKLNRTMNAVRAIARQHDIKIKTKQEVRQSQGLSPKWTSDKSV